VVRSKTRCSSPQMSPGNLKCGEVIPFGAFSGVWITRSLSAQQTTLDRLISPSGSKSWTSPDWRRPSQLNAWKLRPHGGPRTLCPSIMVLQAEFPALKYFHSCSCISVRMQMPTLTSRCPFSETINRSASKERHKLLFLSLSSKLNTMSGATPGARFQKFIFANDCLWIRGSKMAFHASDRLTGVQSSNGGTPRPACLLHFAQRAHLRVELRRWLQRHLPLRLVDTWTDIPANAAV